MLPESLVLLDLETTDVSEALAAGTLPEIVEVGAIRVDTDLQVISTCNMLVQPRNLEAFTEYSVGLTGITVNQLEKAEPWLKVYQGLVDLTGFTSVKLCAWGVDFDVSVLRADYRRAGLGYPHNNVAFDARSMVFGAAARWGWNFRGWNLKAVCDRFGVEHIEGHRALPHARQVLDVLKYVFLDEEDDREVRIIAV